MNRSITLLPRPARQPDLYSTPERPERKHAIVVELVEEQPIGDTLT